MGKKKSERHHWWPECVSKRWADEKGGVHWLLPTGEERCARPESFGVIGNGHFIKLGREPGASTPWDQNFEPAFHRADDRFPAVIDWLESLTFERRMGHPRRSRFLPQPSSDELFAQMVESLTSLAIRSPMTRESCVFPAEHFRGPLTQRERNSLIALNMRDMHARAVEAFGVRGKATAIWSPDRDSRSAMASFTTLFHQAGCRARPASSRRSRRTWRSSMLVQRDIWLSHVSRRSS